METKKRLILHRGYKGKYLENSLLSFEQALKQGFDFETDIRVSRDGGIFLIHDDTLDRLFNCRGKIKEKNSLELKKCSFKEDQNLILVGLEELCRLIDKIENKQSKIFIHIKELEDISKVINILDRYNLKDRIRFFACDELTLEFIKIIKEKYSGYKVGLHVPEDSPYKNKESFEKTDFIWADEITFKNINKEMIELARRFNKPVYAISLELIDIDIFDEAIKKRWKEILDLGIEGICTDKPEEFLEFLDEY